MSRAADLFIGIDVGTSGCRAVAIDGEGNRAASADAPLPPPRRTGAAVEQDPEEWWAALCAALDALLGAVPRARVRALAVDGTSGTVLISNTAGQVLAPALLYNDNRAVAEAERLRALAPRESAAHGTSSGLAKLLWLLARHPDAAHVHSPADWLSARFTGRVGISDTNNVIKLGFDAVARRWPAWMETLVSRSLLPEVVAPGAPLGTITKDMARRFGLPARVEVVAGTTDSTAAVIATGAHAIGDAVTSLGSTLVMKVIAAVPVFAPEYGVYSQPSGSRWLVGGGSNSGGAVLRHFFTDAQLSELEPRLSRNTPRVSTTTPCWPPASAFRSAIPVSRRA